METSFISVWGWLGLLQRRDQSSFGGPTRWGPSGMRRQDPGADVGAWVLPGQPAPTCRFQWDQSEKRCQRADAPRGPGPSAATHSPASLGLARGESGCVGRGMIEGPWDTGPKGLWGPQGSGTGRALQMRKNRCREVGMVSRGSPCPAGERPSVRREALVFSFINSGSGPPRGRSLI